MTETLHTHTHTHNDCSIPLPRMPAARSQLCSGWFARDARVLRMEGGERGWGGERHGTSALAFDAWGKTESGKQSAAREDEPFLAGCASPGHPLCRCRTSSPPHFPLVSSPSAKSQAGRRHRHARRTAYGVVHVGMSAEKKGGGRRSVRRRAADRREGRCKS